jgi:hypothetical protein
MPNLQVLPRSSGGGGESKLSKQYYWDKTKVRTFGYRMARRQQTQLRLHIANGPDFKVCVRNKSSACEAEGLWRAPGTAMVRFLRPCDQSGVPRLVSGTGDQTH